MGWVVPILEFGDVGPLPIMLKSPREVFTHLSTPAGVVFAGPVEAAEFRSQKTTVQLVPGQATYFGTIEKAEIVLRIGREYLVFSVVNGTASVKEGELTVLAEAILPVRGGDWGDETPGGTGESAG